MSISPEDIRAFANLPAEVPEALLSTHIGIAVADLMRATGLSEAPQGQAQIWAEALTVRALANAFPWLNTFALNGAAKIGRLEGSIEYRFLDAAECEEKVKNLTARFDALVVKLTENDDSQAGVDGIWLTSV